MSIPLVGDIVTYKLTTDQRAELGGNHLESLGDQYAYVSAIVTRVNSDGTETGTTVNLQVIGDGEQLYFYISGVPIAENSAGGFTTKRLKEVPVFHSDTPYEEPTID